MRTRPRIYVAGPISANTSQKMAQNVGIAIDVAMELIQRGYSPFIPHLDYYIRQRYFTLNYETFMELDIAWINVSDAMFVIAESPGVLREIEVAKKLLLPIYFSMKDVPDHRELR